MGYLVYLREGPHKRRCTAGMGTTSPSVMVTTKKTVSGSSLGPTCATVCAAK